MMLSIHFELIAGALEQAGYKTEILKTNHKGIVEEGLRCVHNDTCYPALLVIGQFMDALKSGKYDNNKVALLISQTGGGCRASNYIFLLRKALFNVGLGHVPVISVNFSGLERQRGFHLDKKTLINILYSLMYGDFLMWIQNQCLPYEVTPGSTQAVVDKWVNRLNGMMSSTEFLKSEKYFREILADFAAIERDMTRKKIKVGIVGEIYVKYAPLGNNDLEKYLVDQGAEIVNSGIVEFFMYSIHNLLGDRKLHGGDLKRHLKLRYVMSYISRRHRRMIAIVRSHGVFRPPVDFSSIVKISRGYLNHGVKMGEGWLLTAEMLELIDSGVNNIISAQPFGCLPNHIVAKGMMRRIKDNHPNANIVAIDYDPGASRINQENRLRLMLANAKRMEKMK